MAYIGYGASMTFSGFPGKVTSLDWSGMKADTVDITNSSSPSRTREFVVGLVDPGEIKTTILWEGYSPTFGTTSSFTCYIPKSASTSATIAGNAILTGMDVKSPVDGRVEADVTFKLTGVPTIS